KNDPATATDPLGLIDSQEALQHYIEGSGTPLRMSLADIDTSLVTPWQFPTLRQLRQRSGGKCFCPRNQRSTIMNIDDWMRFQTKGDQALFLGIISLRLEGTLTMYNDCTWSFSGSLKAFDDPYDFNWSTHRELSAEILTRLGSLLPGKRYLIEIRGSKPILQSGYTAP